MELIKSWNYFQLWEQRNYLTNMDDPVMKAFIQVMLSIQLPSQFFWPKVISL